MVAGDIFRVTFQSLLNSTDIAQNVLYYLAGTGVNEPDATAMTLIASTVDNAFASLNGTLANDVSAAPILFFKSTDNGATFSDIGQRTPTAYAPSSLGQMLPNQMAAQVNFGSALTGRLGKKFIAGLTENDQDASILDATAITALINFAGILDNPVGLSGGSATPGWLATNPLVFRPYDGTFSVPVVMATQRRRKIGVGI